MNMIQKNRFALAFVAALALFSSCQDSILGDEALPVESTACVQKFQDQFTLELPCDWNFVDSHEEQSAIGSISNGLDEIYFMRGGFGSLSSIVENPEATSYYPVNDGRIVFLEKETQGQTLVFAYFESEDAEGLTTRLTFWFVKNQQAEVFKARLLSLVLV